MRCIGRWNRSIRREASSDGWWTRRYSRRWTALPPEFREVLVLSDIEGMPYADIAETMKVPVGTVKSRLFRARRLLQAQLYTYAVEMGYIKPRKATDG